MLHAGDGAGDGEVEAGAAAAAAEAPPRWSVSDVSTALRAAPAGLGRPHLALVACTVRQESTLAVFLRRARQLHLHVALVEAPAEEGLAQPSMFVTRHTAGLEIRLYALQAEGGGAGRAGGGSAAGDGGVGAES